ncbi:hypothetical protein H0H92_007521 [Tricholoma furcatifolium]|nr:hypothetical protein H0H92_007521 [Tricholoma furcatifolium]
MAQVQKTLFLQSKQGSFVLGERRVSKPGPGQLLVRNEAVALNPADWILQKLGIFIEQYPAVVGLDVAGVVAEVGEDVSGFAPGDRNDNGAFQQYTLSDTLNTAKIPPQISFEAASSIPACLGTAAVGLYAPEPHGLGFASPFNDLSARGKYSEIPIVIVGGATSNGQFTIQLASLSGFYPIIAIASLKHIKYLKSIGATHVVDRNAPESELAERISEITTKPITLIYVSTGYPEGQRLGYRLLAKGGCLATVTPPAVEKEEGKDIIHVLGFLNRPHTRELGIQLYRALSGLLDQGLIKPNRVEVLPGGLDRIIGGLERMEANQVSGVKLVVNPQETK